MAITYTTWNQDDKNANITLSNGNLTATATYTAWKSVRAILGKPSGKWYWEIKISVDANRCLIGIGTIDESVDTYVGDTANGYSYHDFDGQKFHDDVGTVYGDTFTLNDIIGIALDLDNGKLWFSKNGVWQASGDPEAGTNEAWSGISGTFFPMYSPYANTDAAIANFGASSFSYSVPSGFNSGFYSGTPETFTFTNPTPAHLSTVYGTTEQVCLTTTISGEAAEYVYDATFYDSFDVKIGTTVSGIQSGQSAESNEYLSTPSGIDYGWYMTATSSGGEDTSDTYTFHNRFLYEGYVSENDDPVSRKVNLYYRSTGELIDTTTSSGSDGYYKLSAVNNDTHFIVAFDDEAGEDYNALILDKLLPVGPE